MKHPTDEALLLTLDHPFARRGADGGAGEARAAALRHVRDGCRACESRAREFLRVFEAMEAPPLAVVPESLLRSVAEEVRAAEVTTLGAGLQEIAGRVKRAADRFAASLVFESPLACSLPGIRGRPDLLTRQMLYESRLGNLHLQISSGARHRAEIRGQFLPVEERVPDENGVVIVETNRRRQAQRLAPSGEFCFTVVGSGPVLLLLEWAGETLTVEGLRI